MTALGKRGVIESPPNFGGMYLGAGASNGPKTAVELSNCTLWLAKYLIKIPEDFDTLVANNEFRMAKRAQVRQKWLLDCEETLYLASITDSSFSNS